MHSMIHRNVEEGLDGGGGRRRRRRRRPEVVVMVMAEEQEVVVDGGAAECSSKGGEERERKGREKSQNFFSVFSWKREMSFAVYSSAASRSANGTTASIPHPASTAAEGAGALQRTRFRRYPLAFPRRNCRLQCSPCLSLQCCPTS